MNLDIEWSSVPLRKDRERERERSYKMYNDTQRNVVLKVEYRGREQKARTR